MQRGSERDSIQSTLEDRPTWEFERVVVAQIGKNLSPPPLTMTMLRGWKAAKSQGRQPVLEKGRSRSKAVAKGTRQRPLAP